MGQADHTLRDWDGVSEFYIDNLAGYEHMPGGLVRLYFGAMRAGRNVPEYVVIVPIRALADMCANCMSIAVDGHNEEAFRDLRRGH